MNCKIVDAKCNSLKSKVLCSSFEKKMELQIHAKASEKDKTLKYWGK